MNTYPTSLPNPSVSSTGGRYRPKLRHDFESGHVDSRHKHTRGRRIFSLRYHHLTQAHRTTLDNFFEAEGSKFLWDNPDDGVQYTVRFADDNLDFKFKVKYNSTVTVNLEEAL